MSDTGGGGDRRGTRVTFLDQTGAKSVEAVIAAMRKALGDKILLGAGTVLDPETARAAFLAGAEFLVELLEIRAEDLRFTQDEAAFPQAWDLFKEFGKSQIKLYTSAGNDRMVWNPGEGTDLFEGGDGVRCGRAGARRQLHQGRTCTGRGTA